MTSRAARGGGLGEDQSHESLEHGLQASLPRPVAVAAVDGGHRGRGQVGEGVERRQEALELVVEIAVEGAPRDAGDFEDVGDAGALVAVLGDGRDRRPEEALALVALDRGRVVSRTGSQLPRAQLVGCAPGCGRE